MEWAGKVFDNDELAEAWGWTAVDENGQTFQATNGADRNLSRDDALREFSEHSQAAPAALPVHERHLHFR